MKKGKDLTNIKAILLGDVGVGKTNLINITCGQDFNRNEKSTVANSFMTRKINYNGKDYTIELWDTAGQEKYYHITKIFFKGSNIVIFVFDVTNKSTFEGLKKWIDMTNQILDGDFVCGLVGNKNDLFLNSQISEEECKNFADSKKYKFKLVSALKSPKVFNEFFDELCLDYIKSHQNYQKRSISLLDVNEEHKKCPC